MVSGTEDKDAAHGNGKILVVDDEELVLMCVARMLELGGFSVLTAAGGVEAVDLMRQHHGEIACVLLDLKMPHMDGEQTLSAIREIDSDVPVILSSGYSEQEVTDRFTEAELAGFIQKPYRTEELKRILRKALG